LEIFDMAFMECRFHSVSLARAVNMNVIIPQYKDKESLKIVFLLHGLSDDASMWFRRTSVERYADMYNMMVIMPDGGRSFYTDAVAGDNYWTFISEELPQTVQALFNVTVCRENSYAAGLSMGGYGALKLALRCRNKFTAAAGLSSLTDIKYRFKAEDSASWRPEMRRIFGSPSQLVPRKNDLFALAKEAVSAGENLPNILSICGSEDFMIMDNRKFNKHMRKINYPGYYSYERPGSHNWQFWDTYIQDAFKFFNDGTLPE